MSGSEDVEIIFSPKSWGSKKCKQQFRMIVKLVVSSRNS